MEGSLSPVLVNIDLGCNKDYSRMVSVCNSTFHIKDRARAKSSREQFNSERETRELTGIQWQLKVNFETSSHVPARQGFGSHGFVQF